MKDHCIENDIMDEVEEKPIVETAEAVRLKLDYEHEERRLVREEAQRAHEARKHYRMHNLLHSVKKLKERKWKLKKLERKLKKL